MYVDAKDLASDFDDMAWLVDAQVAVLTPIVGSVEYASPSTCENDEIIQSKRALRAQPCAGLLYPVPSASACELYEINLIHVLLVKASL
jgi:hypothetical protein